MGRITETHVSVAIAAKPLFYHIFVLLTP